MKKNVFLLMMNLLSINLAAQVYTFSSESDGQSITHKILKDSEYLIETQYETDSKIFVSTRGGFYKLKGEEIQILFEFNSNYSLDSLKSISIVPSAWKLISAAEQIHSGKWLMAGRVKAEGEKRRNINGARKTLKFLLDGHFQWTAFNTETFQFFGSGGGTYSAKEGDYIETIGYFSRDNSRVGAVLPFRYDIKGMDWYHQGLNSKGKPMHEIWTKRVN